MAIVDNAGMAVTSAQAASNMATVLARVFIADQNYYSMTPQQDTRVLTRGIFKRIVLYKGQRFGNTTFLKIFGDLPEDAVRAPTPDEVETAVANYFSANPPLTFQGPPGNDGAPASDAQVSTAVATYMQQHPVVVPPAVGPTDQQVSNAVTTYMSANASLFKGSPGIQGPAGTPTAAQVSTAVNAYLSANPTLFKGDPGIQGPPGTPADMTRVSALESWQATQTTAMTSAQSAIAALQTAVGTLQGYACGKGVGTVSANILIGSVGNLTINWSTGFQPPDTNYFVVVVQNNGTAAVLSIVGPPTTKTTTTCVIPVKNIGSVAAGSGFEFRAEAFKY